MNFYMKVLAGFASTPGLKLSVTIDAHPRAGVSKAKIEEIRIALRELGMAEDVEIQDRG